ncbi:class I SAM-dependent methyltransferase [Microbulbifer sp. HZ11]|uniref:class I SAM-dependent methyltransferase n=1 Tax=Microbulbifer sp. HZ11 TaxID=1453501 RepID=UPI0005BD9E84|nr:class I SAM-dependent methyltransferase [Microbulbifer sp. HZ11]
MIQQHWDEFWQQGYITTFGLPLVNNYTGKLRELWEEIFSNLDSGTELLDLATGNGAIPCIAYSTLKKANKFANICAIDRAKIPASIPASPEINEAREHIHFFGDSSCEELIFPDNKFDLITSQFGIEYSEWKQSLPEAHRVLKPGGECHFFCHCDRSALIISTQSDLEVYESALEEMKIFEHAINFTKNFQSIGETKLACTTTLNNAVNCLQAKHKGHDLCQIIVNETSQQLKRLNSTSAELVRESLETIRKSFRAAQGRQKDMLSAALSKKDVTYISQFARDIGFDKVKAVDFSQDGDLVGVYISLTK